MKSAPGTTASTGDLFPDGLERCAWLEVEVVSESEDSPAAWKSSPMFSSKFSIGTASSSCRPQGIRPPAMACCPRPRTSSTSASSSASTRCARPGRCASPAGADQFRRSRHQEPRSAAALMERQKADKHEIARPRAHPRQRSPHQPDVFDRVIAGVPGRGRRPRSPTIQAELARLASRDDRCAGCSPICAALCMALGDPSARQRRQAKADLVRAGSPNMRSRFMTRSEACSRRAGLLAFSASAAEPRLKVTKETLTAGSRTPSISCSAWSDPVRRPRYSTSALDLPVAARVAERRGQV